MTLSLALADTLLALWQSDLPEAARERARVGLLDTIGVTLAGSVHDSAAILRHVAGQTAAAGPVAVIGTGLSLNAADAALLNGHAGHILDFDDSNGQLHGHPSVAVLPAVLSAALETGASGDDILRAYVCGIETAGRLGLGVARRQYTHGWHPTVTIGIFGAVAGAALIHGLSREQIATAFGIAVSMASGVKSNFGSMVKPLIVGHANRNAILAVKLAQAGFTSSLRAFEHHHGYLNVFNDGPENYDTARILEGWGAPLCVVDLGLKQKRYPCCYACLPAMDVLEGLIAAHGIRAEDVAALRIGVHAIRYPHINVPDPQSDLDAKFSVHYCAARVLREGRLSIEAFEGDAHREAALRALMGRITLSVYDRESTGGAEIEITLADGRVLSGATDLARGADPRAPLPLEDVRRKFADNAGRALGAAQAAALETLLLAIEAEPDTARLAALLHPPLETTNRKELRA